MIRFENVSKQYPAGTHAVKSLNFDIKEGEFFVLIGPSGCGKTTTLKLINRLHELTTGYIYIDGKKISEYDIHELRWNIGYVLQQIALFPHMSIEENIAVVPELRKWSKDTIRKRVDELLELVGLEPDTYRDRKPKELSGGQQQRIGVIRALAADPQIILMDEPFSALDPISREKLQDDLLQLKERIKKTIVFVTHDIQEALKLGDRICVMQDGEIVQIGTPEEITLKPANNFVKEFIGDQKPGLLLDDFVEKALMQIPEESVSVNPKAAIPASSTVEQALKVLSQHDVLAVEKEGQIIGVISRQSVIQYLAERSRERGKQHG
ncbi:ABC transporter ATP-binding protein [Peribacillus glennii]|uniref:Quaternary amine transport ATP-binding protein n=1 Tax=Peribacillus glennii TaxID=2303991 RepID=A0A372LEM6_9BACI|nr:ABC transporter ATP-binding protein [Peribacillus glennii]RFU64763.1 ABC transporter ATP-binding protein [Peribacillus glennii]